MSVIINYKKPPNKSSANIILFVEDNFNLQNIKKYISSKEYFYISDLTKMRNLENKIQSFDLNSKRKIILVSIKKDSKNSKIENLGAELYSRINNGKNSEYSINSKNINTKHPNFISHFLHGLKLKSYTFHKYKTKKNLMISI